MNVTTAIDLGRDALFLVLTVSAPIMLVGLTVGLSVALFQAVTQLQEQTLHFVPKIVGMVIAAVVFVPWIAEELIEFAREMLAKPPF
jgi:flagellar biosynthetic protein FliQ